MRVFRVIVCVVFLAIAGLSIRAHLREGRPTRFIIRHPGESLLETFYDPCWPNERTHRYFSFADKVFWVLFAGSFLVLIPKRDSNIDTSS